jgi:hypothetical protein
VPEVAVTFRDDEIAAGFREMLERELTKSVAQVLHLLPGTHAAHRRLHDVGVEFVLSVAFIRAADLGEDIAGDYARAKAEVMTVLRGGQPASPRQPGQASTK